MVDVEMNRIGTSASTALTRAQTLPWRSTRQIVTLQARTVCSNVRHFALGRDIYEAMLIDLQPGHDRRAAEFLAKLRRHAESTQDQYLVLLDQLDAGEPLDPDDTSL